VTSLGTKTRKHFKPDRKDKWTPPEDNPTMTFEEAQIEFKRIFFKLDKRKQRIINAIFNTVRIIHLLPL